MEEIDIRFIHLSAIEAELPEMLNSSPDRLLEQLGELWETTRIQRWDDLNQARGDWMLSRRMDPLLYMRDQGEKVLESLRPIICDAANKKLVDGTLRAANVAAFADLLLPHFSAIVSQSPSTVPAPIIGFAVLVLRIGLNEYCKAMGAAALKVQLASPVEKRASPATPVRKKKRITKEQEP